jgi:formate C-acetyltransferase
MADAAFFNLPTCMVDALLKKEYKDVNDLNGLKDAFKKEVQLHVKIMIKELQRIEQTRRDHYPLPLVSLMVNGCVHKKKDVTAGGAVYNWSSIQAIGVADSVDSFAAIEQAMNDQTSLETIRNAIRKNFKGSETLHQALNSAPKFGKDDIKADQYLDFVLDCYTTSLTNSGKSVRDGYYVAGGFSSGAHQLLGRKTWALPSGRKRGFRFANGVSPTDAADSIEITATMNSVSRLNPKYYVNGYTFNQKVDPPLMENAKLFAGLLRGFFKQNNKGVQVQFNVINEKVLKDAQANPDKFPWLVVRVSGYSAYFKDLSSQMQDEIIQRAVKKA